MNRRHFLAATAAASLTACAPKQRVASLAPTFDFTTKLSPIRAETDRIFRVTVCLRPFRAAGPRLDTERVGEKIVVHNYGHGGSGWSLSWGSSSVAVEKAMATGERNVAVIGCGALGLTSAILLQRAGAKVTIYAKERPPDVRSARATGSWTPDSRIALTNAVAPDFPALWEKMCRTSFHMYESYLGAAGSPIEWLDRYLLSDRNPRERNTAPRPAAPGGEPDFARYEDRVADLNPRAVELAPGTHPFPVSRVRRTSSLTFNVAAYSRQLVNDFLVEGGTMRRTEFHSPSELSSLPEKTIINATGYGARALWKDESIVPVRGQIAWLIPQDDVHYGLAWKGLNIVGRRDGIVVQNTGKGDMEGYQDDNEQPDRAAADASVKQLAQLFGRAGGKAAGA